MTTLPFARLLVLVVPVAAVGLFARVYYTPDEPREASLVVAMAAQPDKALPELAGQPFAEKPPLLYWLGGAAVAAFGPAPAVARLPNLLYALATALAIGAVSYGFSFGLYMQGLRVLGAARTGALFAVAPFAGAAVAVIALGEPVSARLALAALAMAGGVAIHVTESHVELAER